VLSLVQFFCISNPCASLVTAYAALRPLDGFSHPHQEHMKDKCTCNLHCQYVYCVLVCRVQKLELINPEMLQGLSAIMLTNLCLYIIMYSRRSARRGSCTPAPPTTTWSSSCWRSSTTSSSTSLTVDTTCLLSYCRTLFSIILYCEYGWKFQNCNKCFKIVTLY